MGRRQWTCYLGSTALFLLVVQLLTGSLLLLYYQPNTREAHDSVRVIMTDIPMGWIMRSLHRHASYLLVFTVTVHTIDVLLAKTFRSRRGPTYYTGVLLLLCVLFMGFTGYLLPWDTLSVVATAVGTGLAHDIPVLGPFITEFLRGGSTIGSLTLPRFFAFHISMLPVVVGLVLGLHLFYIRKHGMRRPFGSRNRRVPFYPDFILRQSLVCLWTFALLLTWAILLPVELRPAGDPLAPAPEGIQPEWYFLAVYELIKLGGHLTFLSPLGITAERLSLLLLGIGFGVFTAMPLLDRKGRGLLWKGIIWGTALTLMALTVYALLRSTPNTEAIADVGDHLAAQRLRALGFLLPFWSLVVTSTWIMIRQIRLYDRITASKDHARNNFPF
jgi:quinol-cytochrome oxidoreductase complex cytochrome b subunit